ncbi:MAG: type II secretion system protein [Candidatus Niyogibacteria bacterium]|nr:type II secretion system protein [Candidatus Niyogibacteria bacterium]
MKNNKKGFTLIELLVVIAIIGILASVVLASLNSARKKSRDARRVADIKQVQLALAMYYDANSSVYPVALSALVPAFMPTIAKDPLGNTVDYTYSALDTDGTAATCEAYHLGASLEDGANPSLLADADTAPGTECTNSAADFDGTSAAAGGAACNAPAGVARGQTNPTETCYDIKN